MYAGVPPALKRLLEEPSIVKCGVGINGDLHKLALDHGIHLRGLLDVNVECNRRVQPNGVALTEWTSFTLAEHCARLLHRSVAKPQSLRCSNWEVLPLTSEQQRYAALDAYASLLVADAVEKMPICSPQPGKPLDSVAVELAQQAA